MVDLAAVAWRRELQHRLPVVLAVDPRQAQQPPRRRLLAHLVQVAVVG